MLNMYFVINNPNKMVKYTEHLTDLELMYCACATSIKVGNWYSL